MKSKLLAAIAAVAAVVLGAVSPAAAAPGIWAQWTMAGSGGAYSGTMTVPAPNFPAVTWTSDARADSSVESGASTWHGPATPVGAVYGSSQNQPYLRLRPAADNPTSPSTTTYTFATPTPVGNWAFVLGDIDADEVTISATDADGNPVPVDGLGHAGVYNFCDTSPKPSVCSGVTELDVPTWDPSTSTLHGHDESKDTTGATGWFQPTAPITTLTFVFRQKSGFPIYQTWFVSLPQPPPTTTTTTTATTTTTTAPPPPPPSQPAPPGPALVHPAPPPRPSHRTLPATGGSATRQALLGLGLVVVGAASVGVARLRRRTT